MDSTLNYITTILYGLILGFLSAIPVGAVQLEVIKSAMRGHRANSLALTAGSVTSDFIYGTLTLFGLGFFLTHPRFQIVIYLLGVAVLSFLLYRSYQEHRHHYHAEQPRIHRSRFPFITGFTIAITNPGIIIWWIVGFNIYSDLALFDEITACVKLIFIVAACGGLGGYLLFLTILIGRIKRNLSDRVLMRMNLALMGLLTVLILYFLFKIVQLMLHGRPALQNPMPGL